MTRSTACLATALAAAAALAATVAPPAQATRTTAQAVAICQAALPVFEGQIRKRPLAIQNEGTESAFVTCAFASSGPNGGTHRITAAELQLQNLGSVSRQVTCSAVSSSASASPGTPLYATRTTGVGAGNTVAVSFLPTDFGEATLSGNTMSVSCNLAPGVGITGTALQNTA